jgi:hypothetical protein
MSRTPRNLRRMSRLIAAGLALVLVVGACGKNKNADTSSRIGTDDAPAPAGPPEPTSAPPPGATTTTTAPGRQIKAPWPAPTNNVSALIRNAGLPALPQEMLQYHVHSHLDVFVDGQAVTVPADLGIDRQAGVISPLHTHDDTGIIHVENDTETTFYLGQLFIEWDVRLDTSCIGAYCGPATPIAFYVDGKRQTGDPTKIEFARHREIAIVMGQPPAAVPAKYDWPANT